MSCRNSVRGIFSVGAKLSRLFRRPPSRTNNGIDVQLKLSFENYAHENGSMQIEKTVNIINETPSP